MKKVEITPNIHAGGGAPLLLIAGPCVIESRKHAFFMAHSIGEIARKLGIPYVFKSSYDKANRTSINSFRGPGPEGGLKILQEIKNGTGFPVLTDVHSPQQAELAARFVDVIQIPAFLCRQTDLLLAAAGTGLAVNVKKGQFLAPGDIAHAVGKLEQGGCEKILLTERGTTFGYHNLVVDLRSLVIMRETGYPIVFDATHSVQMPGGAGGASGGDWTMAPHLARGAAGVGIDALFLEVHDNPEQAKSDGPNMIPLDKLEGILKEVTAIDNARREVGK